jgi:zinc protease
MIASVEMQRNLMPYPPADPRYTPTADEQLEAIKSVTLDQVKQFYQQFYGLGAGEAVLIGDVDTEAAQKQLAGLFNGWKSGQSYARVRSEYRKAEQLNKVFETPDKANAIFFAALSFPMKDTDPDYPALALGNYILGSGLNSRLFARIRGKEGLSYGVGSQLATFNDDQLTIFLANAICNPANAPKVEAAFKDEMAKVLKEGYTEAEVEAAKKSWLDSRAVSRANDSELAGRMSNQRYLGRTMAFDADLEAKVMKLTPAAIQAAMQKHLDPARMSLFKAGDFKKAGVAW